MTVRLGLTGSIGMGKSTTAAMFADEGCAVWDADAAVHRLYAKGGAAVDPLGAAFPSAIVDNAVSRDALKALIAEDCGVLPIIEQIVHPLVAQDRAAFSVQSTTDILVFDIPLLFETGADAEMDVIVVVSAAPKIQRARVLRRGTMTEDQFEQIRSKQMPNKEKCARADYVITTDTIEHAHAQVKSIVSQI